MWPFKKRKLPTEPRALLGARGEDIAAKFLKRKGYKILQRNVRYGHLELDIIARQGDTVVFAEVRSFQSADFVTPEDSMGPSKIRRVRDAVDTYIAKNYERDTYYRIDIIAIIIPPTGPPQITHHENAF